VAGYPKQVYYPGKTIEVKMRKIIFVFLVFLFCSGFTSVRYIDTAKCQTPDISFWWRAEGTPLHATLDYTTGGDTPAAISEVQFAAGGKTNNGIQFVDTTDNGGDVYKLFLDSDNDIIDLTTAGTLYFWFELSVTTDWSTLFEIYEDADNRVYLYNWSGEFYLAWFEGGSELGITTTGTSYTTNTPYLVQFQWNTSTNVRSLAVYTEAGVLISETISTTAISGFTMTAETSFIYFGNWPAENMEGFMDDIRISKCDKRHFVIQRDIDAYPGQGQ